MESQLNEDEYQFGFEYNFNTWKTWMQSRKDLLDHAKNSKNENLYFQNTNYHLLQHLKHNANPYMLIKTLIDLNEQYSIHLHKAIALAPPPNVILAKTPEDYDRMVNELKHKEDEKN